MLDVKPFRQTPGYCGAASFKMALEYYGVIITNDEAIKLTKSDTTGTKAENMIAAAATFGLKGETKDFADLSDIKYWLDKKVPPIIDWFSTDDGHYSVVIDMDDKNITLQDPELNATKVLDHETFMRVWFDFPNDYIKSKDELVVRRLIAIYR